MREIHKNEIKQKNILSKNLKYDDVHTKICIIQIKNNSLPNVFPVIVSEYFKLLRVWLQTMET